MIPYPFDSCVSCLDSKYGTEVLHGSIQLFGQHARNQYFPAVQAEILYS